MRKIVLVSGILGLFFLISTPVIAADVGELERRIDILSDELDSLKATGAGVQEVDRVKVHGYGELHFNNPLDDGSTSRIDNHRFVIGVHAMLTDWIHLNAEVDFEHAAQELEFELGYLDFLIDPKLNARAGVMLVPVGFLNEFHEPPLFWTVERPEFHNKIVPTTWSAGGAGIFGTPVEGVNYRLYAVNSVQSIRSTGVSDGSNADGDSAFNDCGGHGIVNSGGSCGRFRGSSGIRSGRLQTDNAIAEDWAAVGRLEFSKLVPGLQLGFSGYYGDTTHDIIPEDGTILLLEADMKYRWRWFDMNASIANIDIDDAEALNTFCASASGCSAEIADNIFGWNVQAGVHLPQLMGWNTSQDLIPFFLYEKIRPQDSMPSGTSPSHANNFEVFTGGISYMPTEKVALKLDYQHFKSDDSKSKDQINVGVAYMF